ncbi:hypothetical protein CNMCM5793_008522 [Aspergillus hiratsukae]|uniref:BZIP domain-containing protein n=1 Tax=Aspergillus hiratsukae TaxID=1194566 RepID=A0A8H6UE16_9EURO|nr:hypothetical protein CNMCM5793_008522 [Aspergillus hiratsukae]
MSSQNGEVAPRSTNEGKEKRKPVRRDPEKRRQQNVQAQRKYREKLRKRMDQLEALAASAAQTGPTEGAPATGTRPSEGTTRDSSSSAPSDISTKDFSAYNTSGVSVSSFSAVTPEECQYPPPQLDSSLSALSTWDPVTPEECQYPSQQLDCSLSALSTWDPRTYPPSDESHSPLRVWSSTNFVDPSLILVDKKHAGHGSYWTATVSCGCSTPHIQIRTHGPDPACYREIKILSIGQGAAAADPYANHLRVETFCTVSALHDLGTHVGLTLELVCAENSLSPFFRGTLESADVISAVQRVFKTLKPDLRPNKEQITVRHHPFIDILPFPTLRRNMIKHQDQFDEDEFFHDMLTGLVCWGGSGIGKRDRNISTGYASTGTPWDSRSWEARDWFLKKYWRLLGGEDGELVRQSEWWRSIRGEAPLDVEAEDDTKAIDFGGSLSNLGCG